jgi:ribosomal protein S18 acetylase RimI-like enzyme
VTSGDGPSEPAVRPFVAHDGDAVVRLWSVVFPHDPPRNEPRAVIARKRATQPELFLVAELEGQLVGTVLAGYDGYRGWIYHLAVDPALRRRGIGTRLMRAAEERLDALGCPKVNLQVRATNAAVVDFYRGLGYSVEDHVSMGRLLDKG